MANRQDVEMLQNAIQTLGQGAFERKQAERQQQMEMQRNMIDQQFRQAQLAHEGTMEEANNRRADIQQARADSDKEHYQEMDDANNRRADNANQPKVTAELKSPDGTTMTFVGSPDQLQAMQTAATAKGMPITVSNKKTFAAQFNVGGAQLSFDDQNAANKFAQDMKTMHGIDVYSPQAPNVTMTPGGQELVTDAKGHIIKGAPPATSGKQTIRQVPNPAGGDPLSLTNTTTQIPAMPFNAPVPTALPTPTAQHIALLKSNPTPEYAAFFDKKFGAGASAKVLQPQQPIPGGGGLPITTNALPSSVADFNLPE